MAVRSSSQSSAVSATPALVPQGQHVGKPAMPLGRVFTLVGSRHRAHLHLLSQSVSKAHAVIVNDNGSIYIRDTASREHVYVNDQVIKEIELKHRDSIKIGSFTFRLQDGAGKSGRVQVTRPAEAAVEVEPGTLPTLMDGRTLVIGRRPTCDVMLSEVTVSNVHAIIFEYSGQHHIRDLGSRTGTYVNGEQVHQQALKFGDQLRIGDHELRFLPAQAQEEPVENLDHLVTGEMLQGESVALATEEADNLNEARIHTSVAEAETQPMPLEPAIAADEIAPPEAELIPLAELEPAHAPEPTEPVLLEHSDPPDLAALDFLEPELEAPPVSPGPELGLPGIPGEFPEPAPDEAEALRITPAAAPESSGSSSDASHGTRDEVRVDDDGTDVEERQMLVGTDLHANDPDASGIYDPLPFEPIPVAVHGSANSSLDFDDLDLEVLPEEEAAVAEQPSHLTSHQADAPDAMLAPLPTAAEDEIDGLWFDPEPETEPQPVAAELAPATPPLPAAADSNEAIDEGNPFNQANDEDNVMAERAELLAEALPDAIPTPVIPETLGALTSAPVAPLTDERNATADDFDLLAEILPDATNAPIIAEELTATAPAPIDHLIAEHSATANEFELVSEVLPDSSTTPIIADELNVATSAPVDHLMAEHGATADDLELFSETLPDSSTTPIIADAGPVEHVDGEKSGTAHDAEFHADTPANTTAVPIVPAETAVTACEPVHPAVDEDNIMAERAALLAETLPNTLIAPILSEEPNAPIAEPLGHAVEEHNSVSEIAALPVDAIADVITTPIIDAEPLLSVDEPAEVVHVEPSSVASVEAESLADHVPPAIETHEAPSTESSAVSVNPEPTAAPDSLPDHATYSVFGWDHGTAGEIPPPFPAGLHPTAADGALGLPRLVENQLQTQAPAEDVQASTEIIERTEPTPESAQHLTAHVDETHGDVHGEAASAIDALTDHQLDQALHDFAGSALGHLVEQHHDQPEIAGMAQAAPLEPPTLQEEIISPRPDDADLLAHANIGADPVAAIDTEITPAPIEPIAALPEEIAPEAPAPVAETAIHTPEVEPQAPYDEAGITFEDILANMGDAKSTGDDLVDQAIAFLEHERQPARHAQAGSHAMAALDIPDSQLPASHFPRLAQNQTTTDDAPAPSWHTEDLAVEHHDEVVLDPPDHLPIKDSAEPAYQGETAPVAAEELPSKHLSATVAPVISGAADDTLDFGLEFEEPTLAEAFTPVMENVTSAPQSAESESPATELDFTVSDVAANLPSEHDLSFSGDAASPAPSFDVAATAAEGLILDDEPAAHVFSPPHAGPPPLPVEAGSQEAAIDAEPLLPLEDEPAEVESEHAPAPQWRDLTPDEAAAIAQPAWQPVEEADDLSIEPEWPPVEAENEGPVFEQDVTTANAPQSPIAEPVQEELPVQAPVSEEPAIAKQAEAPTDPQPPVPIPTHVSAQPVAARKVPTFDELIAAALGADPRGVASQPRSQPASTAPAATAPSPTPAPAGAAPASRALSGMSRDHGSFLGGVPLTLPTAPVRRPRPLFGETPVSLLNHTSATATMIASAFSPALAAGAGFGAVAKPAAPPQPPPAPNEPAQQLPASPPPQASTSVSSESNLHVPPPPPTPPAQTLTVPAEIAADIALSQDDESFIAAASPEVQTLTATTDVPLPGTAATPEPEPDAMTTPQAAVAPVEMESDPAAQSPAVEEEPPKLFDSAPEALDTLTAPLENIADITQVVGEDPPAPAKPAMALMKSLSRKGSVDEAPSESPKQRRPVPPPPARSITRRAPITNMTGPVTVTGQNQASESVDIFSQSLANKNHAADFPEIPPSGFIPPVTTPRRPRPIGNRLPAPRKPATPLPVERKPNARKPAVVESLQEEESATIIPMDDTSPLEGEAPTAVSGAEHGKKQKKRWRFPFFGMSVLMIVAGGLAVAAWFALPPQSNAIGVLRFDGLSGLSASDRQKFVQDQQATLRVPDFTKRAQQIYENEFRGLGGEGFLYRQDDPTHSFAAIIEKAHADGDHLVFTQHNSIDPVADRMQLRAVAAALHEIDRQLSETAVARRTELKNVTDRLAAMQSKVREAQQRQAEFEIVRRAEKDLSDRSASLERTWREAKAAAETLQAQVTALTAAGSRPPIEDDAQLKELTSRLKPLSDALADARAGGDSGAAAQALETALTNFQQQIDTTSAALPVSGNASALGAYLVVAQQAAASIRQTQADLVQRRKLGAQTGADLKRALADKTAIHLKEIFAADAALAKLDLDLGVQEHRLGAAVSADLTADAAQIRAKVEELKKSIQARQQQIAQVSDTPELAALRKLIDDQAEQARGEQARADQRVAEQFKLLAAAVPQLNTLPAAQQPLLSGLDDKLSAIKTARDEVNRIATASAGADIKKIESQVADLQTQVDARRRELTSTDAGSNPPVPDSAALAQVQVSLEMARMVENKAFANFTACQKQLIAVQASLNTLQSAQADLVKNNKEVSSLQNELEELKSRQPASSLALASHDPRFEDLIATTNGSNFRPAALGAIAVLLAFATARLIATSRRKIEAESNAGKARSGKTARSNLRRHATAA